MGAIALTAQESGDGQLEEVFELSPFEINTSNDRGYYATNAISGSRISVAIQEMPLTIEVITSEFIEDTGSSDLRDSLRYSAGILLETQNDAFEAAFDDAGGVNNPEGATADNSDSSFKIRGFVTRNTLRNGFRRQHATDTVNIDRIEVVRGPSALLYGVGNFGGVVNYVTKTPTEELFQHYSVTLGSEGLRRATLDVSSPLPYNLGFRFTAAAEERDDWTDLNNHEHTFLSPVVEWKPFKRMKLTVDWEKGQARDNAISFKSVRAPSIEDIPITQTDRLETFGFLEFDGKDPRTFRWSGPDTYLDTNSDNLNITLETGITDNWYILAGYNLSNVTFETLDVFGGINRNQDNPRAQPFKDTIVARQIIDGSSSDVTVEIDNAVLQYAWVGSAQKRHWEQYRLESNYKRELFIDSKWLRSTHSLLLGYSFERLETDTVSLVTKNSPDGDNYMFKNPTDSSYIRFGVQADGTPDLPFEPNDLNVGASENEGLYAVYSGRFLQDRVFLVGGLRRDKTSSLDSFQTLFLPRGDRTTVFEDSEVSQTTAQYGVSVEIIPGLNVFALRSEGIEPNFGGQRDGNGIALESSLATAREVGVKINLKDGLIAATLSAFKIEREGVPFSYWWAPAPIRGEFRRNDPIIYRMDDFDPVKKPDNVYLQAGAEEWQAAVDAKAVYPQLSADGRATYTYLNASTPEGAAFLDAVFDALKAEFAKPIEERVDLDPWTGWLYNGFDDPEVNTAAEDWSSGDYFQSISDQSSGWEAQVFFTPSEAFQLILTYSHVNKEVTNPGNFVTYDFAEGNWDRWATWYFPNANWGLAGVDTAVAYPGGPADNLPNPDTSAWTGVGWGKGEALDDTPEHVVTWWASYRFQQEALKGLQLGLGGVWESKREYASAFTSAGQKKQNETGTTIKAFTDPRLTLNMMVKYSWAISDSIDAAIQLNVDNLLDDTDQYGLLYAPGRSFQIECSVTF